MVIAILCLGWLACGFVAWCACLADFYSIGAKFPRLGTADEQWNNGDRAEAIPIASFAFLAGPVGLLTALMATRCFKTGLRVW